MLSYSGAGLAQRICVARLDALLRVVYLNSPLCLLPDESIQGHRPSWIETYCVRETVVKRLDGVSFLQMLYCCPCITNRLVVEMRKRGESIGRFETTVTDKASAPGCDNEQFLEAREAF